MEISNYLADSEENEFLEYCYLIGMQCRYSYYLENDPIWNDKKKEIFRFGPIAGLFLEGDSKLLFLLNKCCDHVKLRRLLERHRDEHQNSDLALLAKKYNSSYEYPEISESLINWIYEFDYLLAYPLLGDIYHKNIKEFSDNPEKILTYVYLVLKFQEYEKGRISYKFEQENIDKEYRNVFDKHSSYKKYGLIPIDSMRTLYSIDDPARIYDIEIGKTIFLLTPRPLVVVLKKLMEENYISKIAFRGDNRYVYEGENHCSYLKEAVEAGKVFDLNIASLPEMNKLVSENTFDSLWVSVDSYDITFEELCNDFNIENDFIVTQVIHLQHDGNIITHIDHEYVFYSFEEYEERQFFRRKGKAHNRIKTFKVDKSSIPFVYTCPMLSLLGNERKEIEVPFIYFVLNAYFVHKDLLMEYFQKILVKEM